MSTLFKTLPEFDNHQLVSMVQDEKSGLRGFIAIHRGGLKRPAFGATRLWVYASEEDALRDALKLSRMMSYKAALAGLRYGGAKAVLIAPKNSSRTRRAVLERYAQHLNYLGGHFITGTDMGLFQRDLSYMKKRSHFLVGTAVDPTHFTGLGLLYGLEVSLKEVFGTTKWRGRTFAIAGLGKIGLELLRHIYKEAGQIYVADLNPAKAKAAKKKYPKITVIVPEKLHSVVVDVYCPCGAGNAITVKSAKELRCKIVIGGANNQLESDAVGDVLWKRGILYAPDYVVNAGGLMSVVMEFEKKRFSYARLSARVRKIRGTLTKIFKKSRMAHTPPHRVANAMAEAFIRKYV